MSRKHSYDPGLTLTLNLAKHGLVIRIMAHRSPAPGRVATGAVRLLQTQIATAAPHDLASPTFDTPAATQHREHSTLVTPRHHDSAKSRHLSIPAPWLTAAATAEAEATTAMLHAAEDEVAQLPVATVQHAAMLEAATVATADHVAAIKEGTVATAVQAAATKAVIVAMADHAVATKAAFVDAVTASNVAEVEVTAVTEAAKWQCVDDDLLKKRGAL
ncbi:hypothetical protein LTR97_001081 [Elasticomyces elasticus]|uniref:Uncharacterized protein n=1 Tax=Elasticomyces elasticus TaxID=574655 RepID=A0AAN7VWL4_9PEZI|nr:hypothetical protein LTR97_001081 [Elasticomyces elasticus]